MLGAFLVVRAILSGLDWRIWAVLGVVGGLVVAGLWLHHSGVVEGGAETTLRIEEANHAARDRADEASTSVDRCYGGGGTWDRSRGVCHVGAPRQ